MNPHFLLTFGTTMGRTRTLRINHANRTVTDLAVRNTMNTLISSNAIAGASGRINASRRASLVETYVTPIDFD